MERGSTSVRRNIFLTSIPQHAAYTLFEEGLYADTKLTHVLTHVLVKVKLPYAYCPHSPEYMTEMCVRRVMCETHIRRICRLLSLSIRNTSRSRLPRLSPRLSPSSQTQRCVLPHRLAHHLLPHRLPHITHVQPPKKERDRERYI